MASVLLDIAPLVALFKRNDKYHKRAVAWFKAHRGTLLTTQAVVTEAWHLVYEPARLPMDYAGATRSVRLRIPSGKLRVKRPQ